MAVKKIIIVGTGAKGGIKTVIDQHVSTLKKNGGFNVRYIKTHDELSRLKNSLLFIRAFFLLVSVLFYSRIIGEKVVVHSHVSMRGSVVRKFILLLVANFFGARYLLHLHGSETKSYLVGLTGFHRRYVNYLYRQSSCVFVLSEGWKEYIDNFFGINSIVLPNYIEDPVPNFNSVGCVRSGDFPVRLIFLGAFIPRKGVDTLVRAFSVLQKEGFSERECVVDLYGDGPLRDEIEKSILDAGLSKMIRVHFWIDRNQKVSELLNSDCLILPSLDEGLPMVIIEAMATGNAVIATRVGDVSSMIVDGGGVCFPAGDVISLSGAIKDYIQNKDLLVQAALLNRERFESVYSEAVVGNCLASHYEVYFR